jgi:hypothetical protein
MFMASRTIKSSAKYLKSDESILSSKNNSNEDQNNAEQLLLDIVSNKLQN